jgi:hypothetical protein
MTAEGPTRETLPAETAAGSLGEVIRELERAICIANHPLWMLFPSIHLNINISLDHSGSSQL